MKTHSKLFIISILFLSGIQILNTSISYSSGTQKKIKNSSAQQKQKMLSMEVNTAVMVTEELDYGKQVPTIAQALNDIERIYQPADGKGRTFTILDAYGETTPQGKLHISMHVSAEKVGVGMLKFKRTGQIIWQSKITIPKDSKKPQYTGKNLTILIDDGKGKTFTVDGSTNPSSILTAGAKERGMQVQSLWIDGEIREVTFIYSACGCPVKAMVKRVGNRTVRTKDLPVIFPDDPAVVKLITKLMGW